MKKNHLIIIPILLLISSCNLHFLQKKTSTIQSIIPIQTTSISIPVIMPPIIKFIDWKKKIIPFVQKICEINNINSENSLMINTMENNTNGNLQTIKATAVLIDLIENYNTKKTFQLINNKELKIAQHKLGLFAENNLESRSKAISLARYIHAKYMLYSTAKGDVNDPLLELQLILVKTGEIIWTSKNIDI